MATYNGAEFVREQLISILRELGDCDEVVIVDDGSDDATVELIREVADPRVRVFASMVNEGHVRAFSRALSLVRGAYILLSDQDDVWVEGRVNRLLGGLEHRPVAAGAFEYFGAMSGMPGAGYRRPRVRPPTESHCHLRWSAAVLWLGDGISPRDPFVLLPIPAAAEAHDIWLAIVGNVLGGVHHVDAIVLRRRIHAGNLTPRRRRAFGKVIASRVGMVRLMIEAREGLLDRGANGASVVCLKVPWCYRLRARPHLLWLAEPGSCAGCARVERAAAWRWRAGGTGSGVPARSIAVRCAESSVRGRMSASEAHSVYVEATSGRIHPRGDLVIKVVIFDLDDTLISEVEYVASGFRTIARYLAGLYPVAEGGALEALRRAFGESPRNVFDRVAAELLPDESPEVVGALVDIYRSHVPEISFYSACSRALRACANRG